ncbi:MULTISPECIES: DUF1330 domain-containing protein [Sphingomonadaceae]|uniref:DUF1330 domain-containing protein n=2 Tax=Sphingomonadaceae TaxID=41297 RepID=UPI002101A9F4|nr:MULTISPECIES: DUF1330 domain-containing protein [Sphingomonadaceae]
MITEITSVTDTVLMTEYHEKVAPIIEAFGGRFLARAEPCVALEGEWARVVIIEFPSFETAEQFYQSEEYSLIKELRDRAATARIIVLGGVE